MADVNECWKSRGSCWKYFLTKEMLPIFWPKSFPARHPHPKTICWGLSVIFNTTHLGFSSTSRPPRPLDSYDELIIIQHSRNEAFTSTYMTYRKTAGANRPPPKKTKNISVFHESGYTVTLGFKNRPPPVFPALHVQMATSSIWLQAVQFVPARNQNSERWNDTMSNKQHGQTIEAFNDKWLHLWLLDDAICNDEGIPWFSDSMIWSRLEWWSVEICVVIPELPPWSKFPNTCLLVIVASTVKDGGKMWSGILSGWVSKMWWPYWLHSNFFSPLALRHVFCWTSRMGCISKVALLSGSKPFP